MVLCLVQFRRVYYSDTKVNLLHYLKLKLFKTFLLRGFVDARRLAEYSLIEQVYGYFVFVSTRGLFLCWSEQLDACLVDWHWGRLNLQVYFCVLCRFGCLRRWLRSVDLAKLHDVHDDEARLNHLDKGQQRVHAAK